MIPRILHWISSGIGHSQQTRSFAPAATYARVRLRNILQGLASPPLPAKPSESPLLAHCVGWFRNFYSRERQSFLASRRFAKGIPDTTANFHRDGPLVLTLIKPGCLAIHLQTSRVFFHISSFTAISIAFSSFSSISMKRANSLFGNSIKSSSLHGKYNDFIPVRLVAAL